MKSLKIFIVDDDRSIRVTLRQVLEDESHIVEDFATGREMLDALRETVPALVLLDVWLGREDGLEILDRIKEMRPSLPVLMISGHGTIEQAVSATKKGALDFLEKPLSLDQVLARIDEILLRETPAEESPQPSSLPREVPSSSQPPLRPPSSFDRVVGESPYFLPVREAMKRAALAEVPVLIYGEQGTGKELVARNIHFNSRRRSLPFVEVDCLLGSEETLERELYGDDEGEETGRLEEARGGCLFLEQVCELPLSLQGRLLRTLQEGRFLVGEGRPGNREVEVDFRVIASCRGEPAALAEAGSFRKELYYFLHVLPLSLPPIRERVGDIPALVDFFVKEASRENSVPEREFTPGALEQMLHYGWPGNVRELKNVVERLLILSHASVIEPEDVREHLGRDSLPRANGGNLKNAREEFERSYIIQALRQNNRNVSRTARFLGMERTNLHRKIRSLKIDLDRI